MPKGEIRSVTLPQAEKYAINNDVQLPADEYDAINIETLFPWGESRRRSSFLLGNNPNHLKCVRHRSRRTTIVYCYLPRLHRVKRAHGQLSKVLTGFRHIKFTRSDDCKNPVLKPFVDYIHPLCSGDQESPRTAKGVKETVAAVFKVFIREERPVEAQ